jgi:hypothetical protein
MQQHLRAHPHDGAHPRQHYSDGPPAGNSPRPVSPSRAVIVDVGEHTGALVLTAPAEREGLEVEIHPASDPSRRTHVWVLPREGRDGTVYAAVFPSLPAGDYTVLEPDGSVATTVAVPANQVTNATWG